jgi:hypothetical protein
LDHHHDSSSVVVAASRTGAPSLGGRPASSLSTRSASTWSLPPELQPFYERGYVDEDGLTVFDTLHEMQVRSCQVFAKKELFGTYSEDSKQFEWMTFREYGEKVDACRAFLQSVGTSRRRASFGRLLLSTSPFEQFLSRLSSTFLSLQASRRTTRLASSATTGGSGRRSPPRRTA